MSCFVHVLPSLLFTILNVSFSRLITSVGEERRFFSCRLLLILSFHWVLRKGRNKFYCGASNYLLYTIGVGQTKGSKLHGCVRMMFSCVAARVRFCHPGSETL